MRAIIVLAVFIGAWQGLAMTGWLPVFVLPGPLAVAGVLRDQAGLLASHALVTLTEVLAGLVIGLVFGIAAAVAMQLWPGLRRGLMPVLSVSQAVPVFVLAPVLTIWFGYGMGPKVAMTVLLVFFPVTVALGEGMNSVPQPSLDLARIAHASRGRELLWLRLPHALPHLAAGLGIGVTYAPTGAVIGEWIGASKGLGYLMLMANARSRTDLVFAALVIVVAMTLALRGALAALTARWLRG